MASQVGSIIRRCTKRTDEPYNILSWIVHERFQSNLAGCNARFYLLQNGPGVKGMWKEQYARIPDNTVILPPYQQSPFEVIPPYVDFDGIVSHHKFGIIQTALQLGNILSLPVCHIEHTMPTSQQLRDAVPELKKLQGQINLFISSTSRSDWGFTKDEADVIEHGIDSEFWKPLQRNLTERKKQILTVGNDMLNRAEILGFDIFQRVTQGLPVRIVGDTKGLSEPAKNEYDLRSKYDESLIYLNPSRYSPIPMSLLEAASMGCAIVTTDNNLISDIFTHNGDAIKTNDEKEMRFSLQYLLNHPNECKRLGENARETIKKRFSLQNFVKNWNSIFERMASL